MDLFYGGAIPLILSIGNRRARAIRCLCECEKRRTIPGRLLIHILPGKSPSLTSTIREMKSLKQHGMIQRHPTPSSATIMVRLSLRHEFRIKIRKLNMNYYEESETENYEQPLKKKSWVGPGSQSERCSVVLPILLMASCLPSWLPGELSSHKYACATGKP